MKKLKYLVMLIFAITVSSCEDEIEIPVSVLPSNLSVSSSNGAEGTVTITASATDANYYHFDFGDGTSGLNTTGTITKEYTEIGDNTYTVTVTAGSGDQKTITETIQVSVSIAFSDPATIAALTSGSSKTWYLSASEAGHLGVGPAREGIDGEWWFPKWFAATPFEKCGSGDSDCLCDDELTFTTDGNGGLSYTLDNMGQTYFNGAHRDVAGGAEDGDFCYDFDTTGSKTVTLSAVTGNVPDEETTGIQMDFSDGGFMGYYVGSSTYEILAITEDALYVRTYDALDDALAWYHKFSTTPVADQMSVEDDMTGGGTLLNGDLENGAEPWTIGLGPDLAPIVTEGDNTFISVPVDTATDNVFDVNVSQIGLSITPDTNYMLTFDAWSDVDRSILAGIGLSGGDFSNNALTVNLTTAMQTFTLMLSSAGFGDDNSRVLFDLGVEVGTVNIDNITLVEGGDGSGTVSVGDNGGSMATELLINGDFEAGAEPWNAGVEAFDGPPAPVVTEDGNTFYSATPTSPNPSEPFLVNLSQQGLNVVQGNNYILTFDAWSDVDRAIIAGIGESSGSFNSVAVNVDISTTMQTYTLNLTAAGFGGDDIRVLFDSNGEAGTVNIDNVSLVEGGDGSDTP